MTTNTSFQMTYLHKRVTPRPGQEGLWDESTGESYRELIETHAVAGWRFVQAVPLGGECGAYDIVLERTLQYPPLVFAHIPKTGGTSVTKILSTYLLDVVQAPAGAVLRYGVQVPYSDLRPLRMLHRQVRFAGGHWGFDQLQLLLREDPFVLTTVRDPFERLFSILDHEYRVGVDVAEGESEQRKAYAAKMVKLIDGLRAATSREQMRDLLLELRDVSIPTVDYVTYAGNCVATARLECTEIDAFGRKLEGIESSEGGLGLGNVRENTSPSRILADRDEVFFTTLRAAFEEVFEAECAYVAHLRAAVPSVFDDGVWERMLSALWRRPPAMAAEAAAEAVRARASSRVAC